MNGEEAIARIENHKIVHNMKEPRAIYISEALDMAIEAIEQVGCLTDRPCSVCRFKTENGCSRWECVFKGV